MSEYTIVWCPLRQEMIDNWGLPIEAASSMPFLLDAAAARQIQSERGAPLGPFDLLRGILVTHRTSMFAAMAPRYAIPQLVEYLGRGFGIDSLEETILGVAAKLRGDYGNDVSRRALEAGAEMVPGSSTIRSDLVTDLWTLAEQAPEDGLRGLFEAIATHVARIDFGEIYPVAAELAGYANFVALHYLGRVAERDDFLHEVVFNRVHHMAYKQRIRYLVEEYPFDMGKLRVVSAAE